MSKEASQAATAGTLAAEWLARLRDRSATAVERSQFEAWLAKDTANRAAWNEVQRMWKGLDELADRASSLLPPPMQIEDVGRRGR